MTKAHIEMFNGYGLNGDYIKKAGTVCYRSEEKTKKNAEEFIQMFKKRKHMSMLEFSWIVFEVSGFKAPDIERLFRNEKYIVCEEQKSKYRLIVSGNARAFIDFFEKRQADFDTTKEWDSITDDSSLLNYVYSRCLDHSPVVFSSNKIKKPTKAIMEKFKRSYKDVESFNLSFIDKNVISLPAVHKWYAVKLSNVSRGLTHEIVRHRTLSFAQASTRYIDNTNFNIIFDCPNNKNTQQLYKDYEDAVKQLYNKMLIDKVDKDIARQILPIGISNEICIAGRYSDWKHFIELRTTSATHKEIREVAEELEKRFEIGRWT